MTVGAGADVHGLGSPSPYRNRSTMPIQSTDYLLGGMTWDEGLSDLFGADDDAY
jgi:hypothetical protein